MSELITVLVLPFLKTSRPLTLGGIRFRSTRDLDDASPAVRDVITEISRMLFARDNLRIVSATYAVLPYVDLDRANVDTADLQNIQATIAYLYVSPHAIFGNPFLSTEHASFVLFSRASVPVTLVRSEFNTELVGQKPFGPDPLHHVDGYSGLYNFRHHFWVTGDSRVYGPTPGPTLNISQDLSVDVARASEDSLYRILLGLLDRPETPIATRVHTALRWYNSAHREASDDDAALVHLAIAFEALLGLPQDAKSDRLEDAIGLLLGRIPRLGEWSRQFYSARSSIVHQGYSPRRHFVTSSDGKKLDGQVYQSLFSYGTTVFRLCLGTLLTGAELAEHAGLAERFVTKQERFTSLCMLFDNDIPSEVKAERADEIVNAIERFQFVGESGLRIETMLAAIRLGVVALLPSSVKLDDAIRQRLNAFLDARKEPDHYDELTALRDLSDILPSEIPEDAKPLEIVMRLTNAVWSEVFMNYFQLSKMKGAVEEETSRINN